MSFFNEICPLEVGRWKAGIRYDTAITVGKNGQESRNANWQDPLRVYNAIHSVRTKAQADELFSFFQQVRGRHRAFLVKDYNDYRIKNEAGAYGFQAIHGLQVPNGSRTIFQFIQFYFFQPTTGQAFANYVTRDITKPRQGTVQVKINSAVQTEGVHYTVNYNTGQFTVASAPGTGATIEIKLEFFVPCRFDTDELDLEMLYFWIDSSGDRAGVQFPEIPIIEVRN